MIHQTRPRLSLSRAGVTGASPQASPIRRSGALGYFDTLQSVRFRLASRSATWKTRTRGATSGPRIRRSTRRWTCEPHGRALDAADPTESYAQDDTPPLRACYAMSRFAHVFVQRPRGEGTFQNLTLQAYCCEILRSKRFAARTADRTWRPGRTSTESRATPALSPTPRWIRIAAPPGIMRRDPQMTLLTY
jgi:hypothetical protein